MLLSLYPCTLFSFISCILVSLAVHLYPCTPVPLNFFTIVSLYPWKLYPMWPYPVILYHVSRMYPCIPVSLYPCIPIPLYSLHPSLWFKSLTPSSKNLWEFCQLLLKNNANNKCFIVPKWTCKRATEKHM